MSRSQDPDHFFQTSQSLAETSRKAAKSKNEDGAPIRLKSKILAVLVDPTQDGTLYLAESVGQVRRLILDVSNVNVPAKCTSTAPYQFRWKTMLINLFLPRQAIPPSYIEAPPHHSHLLRSHPITRLSSLAAGIKRYGPGPLCRLPQRPDATSRAIRIL